MGLLLANGGCHALLIGFGVDLGWIELGSCGRNHGSKGADCSAPGFGQPSRAHNLARSGGRHARRTNVSQFHQSGLEATYLFPVPKGASVTKFSMWVNGKEMTGGLLDVPKARQIYNDIVRRTKDPGLLEYVDNNVFRLSVFPVQPCSDQKVSLTYSSVLTRDNGIVEYVYPLKAGCGSGQGQIPLKSFPLKPRSSRPTLFKTSSVPHMRLPSRTTATAKRPSNSTKTKACWTRIFNSSTPAVPRMSALLRSRSVPAAVSPVTF